jgi:hypothetical protein
VTTGRAGGFHNAQFASRVAQSRTNSSNSARNARVTKAAAVAVGTVAAGAAARAVVGGRRRSVEVSNPGRKGTALSGVVRAVGKAGKALK